MSKKNKKNPANVRELKGNKRFRRKWITWLRMVRYGANNFTRNFWLTTAATAVMTITLLIVFTTMVARVVLNDTVDGIRKRVDIPINLKADISEKEVGEIRQKFAQLPNVSEISYVSLEESKQNFISDGKYTAAQLQTISELPNPPFYPILKLVVKDPTDTAGIAQLVANDQQVKGALNTNPVLTPRFGGDNNKAIETISSWATMADRIGIIAGTLFVAISMLIIFNTIRMAIFSRKDEIEMMKLIGADKNFIRGPFVIEAVMYGFFAAIFATVLGIAAFVFIEPSMSAYGIATTSLRDSLIAFSPLIFIGMVIIGALIGILSSRLAVRRYLKV